VTFKRTFPTLAGNNSPRAELLAGEAGARDLLGVKRR
jgi:hypothetical protein